MIKFRNYHKLHDFVRIPSLQFSRSTDSRQFKPGDKCVISKTITYEDIQQFSELSGDTNPIHEDSSSGRSIVHGAFLNGLVSSVIGTKLPGPGTLVVSQTLHFPNKCFSGEQVTITVTLTEIRKIMKVHFVCEVEAEKKVVLHGDAKLVFNK